MKRMNTIKFGMSTNMTNRLKSYKQTFPDSHYIYCYLFNTVHTKQDIRSIETIIKHQTIHRRNKEFSTEYRFYQEHEINDLHTLICDTMKKHNYNYNVLFRPSDLTLNCYHNNK